MLLLLLLYFDCIVFHILFTSSSLFSSFLIYDVIDYCITFRIATLYRKLKFACQVCSNGIADILCSIYFEIIELHFCNLDRHLKRAIIIREEDEKPRLLQDMNESMDSDNMGLEDDKD